MFPVNSENRGGGSEASRVSRAVKVGVRLMGSDASVPHGPENRLSAFLTRPVYKLPHLRAYFWFTDKFTERRSLAVYKLAPS
jgi:hypothetical protein